MINDPDWTAPRTGHDWRDEDVLRATAWLRSFVPQRQMARRLDAARAFLLAARDDWQKGVLATLYDPADAMAWYILQAETFALDRQLCVPDAMVRIVPVMTRLGKELELLKTVSGANERARHTMLGGRGQPDSGLFELLVALAYRRRGWTSVEFVRERPGLQRTPDLLVSRPRRRWAVECKRLMPSTYAAREKAHGLALAKPVHELCTRLDQSIIVEVQYNIELSAVPHDYLVHRVAAALNARPLAPWNDEIATARIRSVNWGLVRRVFARDFVYYGSSRMIELLSGEYVHEADHSMAARWRPAPKHPFYADAIHQASVVSWICTAKQATIKKARHFRSILANAERQLPADRPGVVHIGVESGGAAEVGALRHIRNYLEARYFRPTNSRLRWVYASYLIPEVTTARHETWALNETTAPYKIGSHRTTWPLPGHMLLSPESDAREGVYWDGVSP